MANVVDIAKMQSGRSWGSFSLSDMVGHVRKFATPDQPLSLAEFTKSFEVLKEVKDVGLEINDSENIEI